MNSILEYFLLILLCTVVAFGMSAFMGADFKMAYVTIVAVVALYRTCDKDD